MSEGLDLSAACPLPIPDYPMVLLAHGGGGTLMHQLLEKLILPAFGSPAEAPHDSAVLDIRGASVAFTTDSFVVKPLFFPGGDIGSLAIHGTVNDLAMSGARPLYLSASLILEEGLAMQTLWQIVQSMQAAARQIDVRIVTGDTKVVDQGHGDSIFINTAGIGICQTGRRIHPQMVQAGDVVVVSGDLGRHGIAIMAQREGLTFETTIQSDSASVWPVVDDLLSHNVGVHCLRDLTRGGLASAMNEIAQAACRTIELRERDIPVREDVRGACEMLGFDPMYVACEGRFVAIVDPSDADQALALMRTRQSEAAIIGEVTATAIPRVNMITRIGARRIVDMLSGEQLPRIC